MTRNPAFPVRSARRAAAVATASLAVLLAPALARAQAAPIFLDGFFADWTATVEYQDPAGDGGVSGVDFRDLDLANDGDYLFIRFQTTVEVGLQENGSNVVLYLDADDNAATGLAAGGLGAELVWDFGARTGCFYPAGGCASVFQDDLRLRMLPSVTSPVFEVAIGRDVRPNGVNLLFTGAAIRVALADAGAGGDRAPAAGGVAYTFDATPVAPPAPISFARDDPADLRVVTWNTRDLEGGSGFDPAVTPSADRVLSAIAPDVICFQEVYTATAAQAQSLITTFLPAGAPWYAAKQNDCIVVSRHPVLQSWGLDGNLAVRLDADAAIGADLLLVCAHLPCCTNDAGRRAEIDRILAFFRDAMTPGGSVDVPSGTGFMVAGDLNLVGDSSQLASLLTGDIVDQGTFGPDFAPDWDGTALADVVSSQTERRFAYTWRSDGSSFAPGRLDFLIHNDSALERRNHFAVYSPEMSAAALAATGMLAGDVTTVSDHLPHVADFRAAATASVGTLDPSGLALATGPTPGRGAIAFALELGFEARVAVEVFDVRGRAVRSLTGGTISLAPGRHPFRWDGRAEDGEPAGSGVYFARVTAEPLGGGASRTREAKWILLQ